jgi:hypothetical protein
LLTEILLKASPPDLTPTVWRGLSKIRMEWSPAGSTRRASNFDKTVKIL